jgi:hypothetical protein
LSGTLCVSEIGEGIVATTTHFRKETSVCAIRVVILARFALPVAFSIALKANQFVALAVAMLAVGAIFCFII